MEQKMWALRLVGPDDVYAVPDRDIADAAAVLLNAQCKRQGLVGVSATVIEWPYSRESWEEQAPMFQMRVLGA